MDTNAKIENALSEARQGVKAATNALNQANTRLHALEAYKGLIRSGLKFGDRVAFPTDTDPDRQILLAGHKEGRLYGFKYRNDGKSSSQEIIVYPHHYNDVKSLGPDTVNGSRCASNFDPFGDEVSCPDVQE